MKYRPWPPRASSLVRSCPETKESIVYVSARLQFASREEYDGGRGRCCLAWKNERDEKLFHPPLPPPSLTPFFLYFVYSFSRPPPRPSPALLFHRLALACVYARPVSKLCQAELWIFIYFPDNWKSKVMPGRRRRCAAAAAESSKFKTAALCLPFPWERELSGNRNLISDSGQLKMFEFFRPLLP